MNGVRDVVSSPSEIGSLFVFLPLFLPFGHFPGDVLIRGDLSNAVWKITRVRSRKHRDMLITDSMTPMTQTYTTSKPSGFCSLLVCSTSTRTPTVELVPSITRKDQIAT